MFAVASKTNFSEALSAFRRRTLDLTQGALAARLGVDLSVYKNWEYGHNPPVEIVLRLRKMGFVPPDDVGPPLIPASQLLIPIPFIGALAASHKVDWTDPFESESFEFVPPEMGDAKGRYAAKIAGDSMFDLLWPGDICVFQREDVPKIGAVIMFRSFDNFVTVKVLKHDGRDMILHPLNPNYDDCVAEGAMVGYLVGIVREVGTKRVTVYDASGIRP